MSSPRLNKRRFAFRVIWPMVCLGLGYAALPLEIWPTLRARFINTAAVERLGFFGYAVFDATDALERTWRSSSLNDLDPAPYRDYLKQQAAHRPAPTAKGRSGKHVIYLQMEAVDGLVIGARKDGRPLMPFLDQLANDNVYFANTVDNTASGRTTDGEFLVLTSAVPLNRPPIFVSQRLDRIPSMPKVLRAAGYHTLSIHGYEGVFWRRASAHQALGYNEDIFEDQFPGAERIGWGVSDHAVLQRAASIIVASREPLFLHIILLTNHHPFKYYGESIGQPLGSVEASFVQSVGYVDRCIAEFYQALQAGGVLDDCIIAVYSDHDSAATGKLEKYLDRVPRRRISDTVPLIITGLGRPPEKVKDITGLQDLPVIVLEELGLPVPLTFTGNGFGGFGTTVGPMHGALRNSAEGAEPFTLPVAKEELTMLSLLYPEKLIAP